MTDAALPTSSAHHRTGRPSAQIAGGWEAGLLLFMALLYLAGVYINPDFFGSGEAISSILRDTARFGVMAVGMTFVIVDKDLDLSVGSTLGLVATLFSIAYAPSHLDLSIGWAILLAVAVGVLMGLLNGWLVTVMLVPSFIATLTMLFIGRGFVLGLTGGKTIAYAQKAAADPWLFQIGETNSFGFNNQILILFLVALVGAVVLGKARLGHGLYAVGGRGTAALYA